jgi:hypothetical protein
MKRDADFTKMLNQQPKRNALVMILEKVGRNGTENIDGGNDAGNW